MITEGPSLAGIVLTLAQARSALESSHAREAELRSRVERLAGENILMRERLDAYLKRFGPIHDERKIQ